MQFWDVSGNVFPVEKVFMPLCSAPLSPCWENSQFFQSPFAGERWGHQEPWLGKAWTASRGTET